MNKVKSDIGETIQTIVILIVLGSIVEIIGTKFFGVNLFPLIVGIIVLALIIRGLQSDKKVLKWIENKLNKMFKWVFSH